MGYFYLCDLRRIQERTNERRDTTYIATLAKHELMTIVRQERTKMFESFIQVFLANFLIIKKIRVKVRVRKVGLAQSI